MRNFFSGIFKNYYTINKVFLFIIALIILVSLFPRQGKFRYEYQKGKPWNYNDLISGFNFAIQKTDNQIKNEKKEALNNAYLYFIYDTSLFAKKKHEFQNLFYKSYSAKLGKVSESRLVHDYNISLKILDTLFRRGIIEIIPELENKNPEFNLAVDYNKETKILPFGSFFSLVSADKYIGNELKTSEPRYAGFVHPILLECLAQNIVYQPEQTQAHRKFLTENISTTRGMIQKGEKIIAQGELINDNKFQVLDSYRMEYESSIGSHRNFLLIIAGRFLLVALSLFVFGLFMYTFRYDIYANNRNIILLLSLITLMVLLTTYVLRNQISFLYAVPLCLVPLIVRVFYDTRLALFVHIITIGILGFLVPNSFEFLFMQLIAGIITIISVVHLSRRSQFFVTAFIIFVTYSIIYIGMTLIQDGRINDIVRFNFVLFGMSAMLTLFAYPIIFLFERLFGFVSDVSLIELSDTHSPLLRELSLKAPGTFQHSVLVANIAEEAARAIGANAILSRTGAMYHDIGKMGIPHYFIENQSGKNNPHNELMYEESARIIIEHVIQGIEKARKSHIPESVIDFIRTHHGTKYTGYFYSKYREENPTEQIDDSKFRYRGPEPSSKETSIVMMADSVEAASRSLVNPDEDQLLALADRIIDKLMADGQFYNSELTLKEITKIRKIIKHKLMSINHIRIEYPLERVEIK